MRAFVAIPLTETIRSEIDAFLKEVGSVKGIKGVPLENLHITLDFLGEISQKEADLFCDNLERMARNVTPFSLRMKGVGAFPRRSDPKTLWIGMEHTKALKCLAKDVKFAVDSMDQKKFSPHLTVGRVKYEREEHSDYFDRFFRWDQRDFGTLTVDHFQLMKSDLSGKTPVYTVIREFKLMGGKSIG